MGSRAMVPRRVWPPEIVMHPDVASSVASVTPRNGIVVPPGRHLVGAALGPPSSITPKQPSGPSLAWTRFMPENPQRVGRPCCRTVALLLGCVALAVTACAGPQKGKVVEKTLD